MTAAAADARTTVSPSVAALRAEFGPAIERHLVSCGDTIVYVARERNIHRFRL